MNNRGIGEYGWVSNYVGIPYEVTGRSSSSIDCWGLVCMVYSERLAVDLPDWVTDAEMDWDGERGVWEPVETAIDFALIRTSVGGNLPDHWGVCIAGGVLAADAPSSSFVTMDQYRARHPDSQIGVFKIAEGALS